MDEHQTRLKLIDPALRAAGWDTAPAHWVPEYPVAPGRIWSDAKHHNPKEADYVLFHGKRRVAVVEAKRDTAAFDAGETQARFYAEALGLRFTYATNGIDVLEIDLETMATREFPMADFPTVEELLARVGSATGNALETACSFVPWSRAGGNQIRYYQERAVESVIHRFGEGDQRALLTLATGTGKTFIAYQLVHKLTAVKWKKSGTIGKDEPRVLFITDRNILADQAFDSFISRRASVSALSRGPSSNSTGRFTSRCSKHCLARMELPRNTRRSAKISSTSSSSTNATAAARTTKASGGKSSNTSATLSTSVSPPRPRRT